MTILQKVYAHCCWYLLCSSLGIYVVHPFDRSSRQEEIIEGTSSPGVSLNVSRTNSCWSRYHRGVNNVMRREPHLGCSVVEVYFREIFERDGILRCLGGSDRGNLGRRLWRDTLGDGNIRNTGARQRALSFQLCNTLKCLFVSVLELGDLCLELLDAFSRLLPRSSRRFAIADPTSFFSPNGKFFPGHGNTWFISGLFLDSTE